MNKKPQETWEDAQKDILEQIITDGLNKTKVAAQEMFRQEAHANETPPADKKNRRSAVYLYLLILFGAAFLMLLLAYFVQQRSNESTISDLRNSMNLSREELLNEIRSLEGQVDDLESGIENWKSRFNKLEEQAEQYRQEYADLDVQYGNAMELLSGWENFWALEQSYQAEDYEACAALILLGELGEYGSLLPSQKFSERREEIVQAVVDQGLLAWDYHAHISDYEELIDAYFAENPGIPDIEYPN